MSGFYQKCPSRELTLCLDWANGWLRDGEKIVCDLGWSIHPNAGLDIFPAASENGVSKACLVGGEPAQVYFVTASMRTDQQRDVKRSVVVRVSNNKEPQ